MILSIDQAVEHASALYHGGHFVEAAHACRRVTAMEPARFETLYLLGGILLQQGRTQEGVGIVGRALAVEANHGEAHYNLAVAAILSGRPGDANRSLRRLLVLEPQHWQAHQHLASDQAAIGKADVAIRRFAIALAMAPPAAQLHDDLARLLFGLGRHPDAMSAWRRAVALEPGNGSMLNNLGYGLLKTERLKPSVEMLRRALSVGPPSSAVLDNLGLAYVRLKSVAPAMRWLKRALVLEPASFDVFRDLGTALTLVNEFDLALTPFRRGLAVDPGHRDAHSNLIFTLDYASSATIEEQQAERRRWGRRHARPLSPSLPVAARDPSPDRQVRVGYASADFRHHAASRAFGPVVLNHDRSDFFVALYSSGKIEDDRTALFKSAADIWLSACDLGDAELSERIRQDDIDILVDLSGHTDGHRLGVFARKPAPIQITAWGHATGTGLETMDVFLADPVLIPMEKRHLPVEEVVDLTCALPYDPPSYAPAESPRPSASGTAFTFGCFNRLIKVSDVALDVWAEILRRANVARLLLKDRDLDHETARARILGGFQRRGVDPARIVLRGSTSQAEQLVAFREIDVALDPFPQNGGISTFEPLWMGVPVVALLGETPAGRSAAAILSAIGHAECVARSTGEYIDIALRLQASPEILDRWRRQLRADMIASTVADPTRYCRKVEATYRDLWRRLCARQGGMQA